MYMQPPPAGRNIPDDCLVGVSAFMLAARTCCDLHELYGMQLLLHCDGIMVLTRSNPPNHNMECANTA
jgi:hypothetical protein